MQHLKEVENSTKAFTSLAAMNLSNLGILQNNNNNYKKDDDEDDNSNNYNGGFSMMNNNRSIF